MPKTKSSLFGAQQGFSKDDIKAIAVEARKNVSNKLKGQIVNVNGNFLFSEKALEAIGRTGKVIVDISSAANILRLPETKVERQALAVVLTNSLLERGGILKIVCPVCPDHGSGDKFYRGIGGGIGSEAEGAIISTKILLDSLLSAGFDPKIKILVADTEDDVPEVVRNSARGDTGFYKSQCQESVYKIRQMVVDVPRIEVLTFSDQYGDAFRETQYMFEAVLRSASDVKLVNLIKSVGEERVERHSQILGRKEEDYELTVRYMAQYAALGHLVRRSTDLNLIMNYPTPNRRFFNARRNVSNQVALDEDDHRVIPVVGTIVKR